MQPLRIGVLGAARIVPFAVLGPARETAEVSVPALAARDLRRAQRFAASHGIARTFGSYQALVADPEIDAVYIPLPNGLHGRWTMAALEAGKHVLCEKPFTANAEEAEAVRAIARRTGLVCMEAFHYRYHALTRRMLEIVASGELGEVQRIETALCLPLLSFGNIRWDLSLAGGALMDVGCYTIHMLRTLAGAEPIVRSAHAKLLKPEVDRLVRAEMEFPDGRTGSITASMLSTTLFKASARVIGSKGTLEVSNPLAPQYFHRIRVHSMSGTRAEKVERRPSSYASQLRAFVAAVRRGESFPTNVDDAVANMRVIDACYRAAGLPPREPTRLA
jgi:predicted dehydrogenase